MNNLADRWAAGLLLIADRHDRAGRPERAAEARADADLILEQRVAIDKKLRRGTK